MKSMSTGIWADLQADLSEARVIWQLVAIALCVVIGWGLAALIKRSLKERRAAAGDGGSDNESVLPARSSVLAPVIAVLLLWATRPLLEFWNTASLVRMAIALLGSFALIRAVFFVLRRVFARGGRVGKFLLVSERVFALLVWLCVAVWITGLWPDIFEALENTRVPLGTNRISVLVLLQGALSVGATLVLALWGGAMLEERLMRIETVHSSLRAVMARTVRALLVLLAVLLSLSLVGIDLTVLSVFGGALGVGLGLGLQKIVGSYFSGFVILLERSLSLGDQVKVGEHAGKVVRINTRYTVLRAADGLETIIPNDMLVSLAVQNSTLANKAVRLCTQVTVAHGTDIESLLPRLIETVAPLPRVLQTPKPEALLLAFVADGLQLEIGFWINDPENGRSNLVSEVNRGIWTLLRQQGISVPTPQRELRILSDRHGEKTTLEKTD